MARFATTPGPEALRICGQGVVLIAHDEAQARCWCARHGYFEPVAVPVKPRHLETGFVLDLRLDEPPA